MIVCIPYEKHWTLDSVIGEEKVLLDELAVILMKLDPASARSNDILSAVAEACLNAFEHGNRLIPTLPVQVYMVVDDGGYCFRIFDEGSGFTPILSSIDRTDTQQKEARGWGLLIMRNLADRCECGRNDDHFYVELQFRRSE